MNKHPPPPINALATAMGESNNPLRAHSLQFMLLEGQLLLN